MPASSSRLQVRWYFLALFALLVLIYCLVFFSGNHKLEPKLGIDLQGGSQVTLRAVSPDKKAPDRDRMEQAKQIIEQRVNGLGVSESEVVVEGQDQIVISAPGKDSEGIKSVSRTAQLRFREVAASADGSGQQADPKDPTKTITATPLSVDKILTLNPQQQLSNAQVTCDGLNKRPAGSIDDKNAQVVSCNDRGEKLLLDKAVLTGDTVSSSSAVLDSSTSEWKVLLSFKSDAQKTWADFTDKKSRETKSDGSKPRVAIVLDNETVSDPSINVPITGETEITGQFDQAKAQELANVLKYGALPLTFRTENTVTVSPTLGLDQLLAGLLAGGIGLILVVLYSLFYYRLLGLVTIASLVVSGGLILGMVVLLGRQIGFTLALPGIAGFIVAVGITADSFVVFFERLKDEVRDGRSLRSAVPRAWTRARRTILSADTVSLLAAAVLYFLAVGQVRGFAFTLGLSTLIDLVVVFLFTHPIVAFLSRFPRLTSARLTGLSSKSKSDTAASTSVTKEALA